MDNFISSLVEENKKALTLEPKPLKTLLYPNPILNKKSGLVLADPKIPAIQELIKSMLCTMRFYGSTGLSAIQIGIPYRIITISDGVAIVDEQGKIDRFQTELVLINPHLSNFEGSAYMKEGCLSFPGVVVDIVRPECVTVDAMDENGNKVSYNLEGHMARIVQHECEHLDGISFLEKVSKYKRDAAVKKYIKVLKNL